MEIRNYTPHEIKIIREDGSFEILPSAGLARCVATSKEVKRINGIPVNVVVMGDVTGLPEETEGTVLIVSRIVAEAVKGTRNDIVIVDKTVRDANGAIVGCTALATL